MSLERHEKINLGFLIGGGILLAVLSVAFRFFVDRRMFGLPGGAFDLQYVLGVSILGLLVLLLWQSNSQMANYAYAVIAFAFGIGLLFPPATMTTGEALMTSALLPIVVAGGVYHYRFNNASNTLFIGILCILTHIFYLFAAFYMISAAIEFSQPLILVGLLVLTGILHGVRRVLLDDLTKTKDESQFAKALGVFLAPTRLLE